MSLFDIFRPDEDTDEDEADTCSHRWEAHELGPREPIRRYWDSEEKVLYVDEQAIVESQQCAECGEIRTERPSALYGVESTDDLGWGGEITRYVIEPTRTETLDDDWSDDDNLYQI